MLSPFALGGVHWIRIVALPLGILVGIVNGFIHIAGSLLYRRWMAGILSSPLLLLTGGSCCGVPSGPDIGFVERPQQTSGNSSPQNN